MLPLMTLGGGTVAAWLLTIARNVAINMLPSRRVDPIDPEVLVAMEGKERHEDKTEARFADGISEGGTRSPPKIRGEPSS
jgi:DNA-directed RNA polymerase specialized sigma24 family protein